MAPLSAAKGEDSSSQQSGKPDTAMTTTQSYGLGRKGHISLSREGPPDQGRRDATGDGGADEGKILLTVQHVYCMTLVQPRSK